MTTATSAVKGRAPVGAPRWVTSGAPRRVEDLEQWLDAQILADIGWDALRGILVFPAGHPLVGWKRCQNEGCPKQARRASYRGGCRPHGTADVGKPPRRATVGISSCAVTNCGRPWHNEPTRLCSGHLAQQKTLRLSLKEFVAHRKAVPYAGVGNYQADGCPRDRDSRQSPYCAAHRRQWHKARLAEPGLDETLWRRPVAPIPENSAVSLRGLAEPLRLEIL